MMAATDIVRSYRVTVEETGRELETQSQHHRRADGAQRAGGRRRAAPYRGAIPQGRVVEAGSRGTAQLPEGTGGRAGAGRRAGDASRRRHAACDSPGSIRPPNGVPNICSIAGSSGQRETIPKSICWLGGAIRAESMVSGSFRSGAASNSGRAIRRNDRGARPHRLLPAVLPRCPARTRHQSHADAPRRHAARALSAGAGGAGQALSAARRAAGFARCMADRQLLRMVSPIDGVERFVALTEVPEYSMVVLVTRDAAAALAPWREQAIGTAARTLALGAWRRCC